MKILLALVLAFPGAPGFLQDDDAEAKKKKLGELFQKFSKLQGEIQKLLDELSGGDRQKERAILTEVMEKYAPEMAKGMRRSGRASNERNASTTLKTFASAQADFRANDRDGNRVNDFWTADVSGLYRIEVEDRRGKKNPVYLIEQSAAQADASPAVPLDKAGKLPNAEGRDASRLVALGPPSTKAGYWFVALKYYVDLFGEKKTYNQGNGRAPAQFAIAAYPADYGKTGTRTFLINEGNTVYWKDTKGKPPELFPVDLEKEGWRKLD